MNAFVQLLGANRNYRYSWCGQIVSEIGDHFNNVAVFSLAVEKTHSPMVVSLVFISRAVPAVLAGPLAGVVLDRFDRRQIMFASDLIRAVVAACFIFTVNQPSPWLLYLLTAILMGASPFFTAGRASILPTIATKDELHTANSLTQTTSWTTLAIGAFLGGFIAAIDYKLAFAFNALSFLVSAFCVARLKLPGGFRAKRTALNETEVAKPWHVYKEGLRYIRSVPLVFGLLMIGVGWATGGGAAQILFSVFGEIVFKRGPAGLGAIWGCAGVGLVIGGTLAYNFGKRLTFSQYKKTVAICYLIHGGAYVLFSQSNFAFSLFFIGLSRAAVGITSVLNQWQLLRTVPDEYRGRVFSTNESLQWSVMMVSQMLAGVGSQYWDPRAIGAIAGVLSSTTAIWWTWANYTGRLPEPARPGIDPDELEVRSEPAA